MKTFLVFAFLSIPLVAQDPVPVVDPAKVAKAIDRGTAWLLSRYQGRAPGRSTDELVLWTLLHAGCTDKEPVVRMLLSRILASPLCATYNVALQAMILEGLDRVAYQPRLAYCARFLVESQYEDGSWSYEGIPPMEAPVPGGRRSVSSWGGRKPKVEKRIPVKRPRRLANGHGDNSNSQYAALGLRACHDAGIDLPEETIERAAGHMRKAQAPAPAVKDPAGDPRGWGYGGSAIHEATGSMTAGGLGSLILYDHIAGADWTKDEDVRDGLAWLAKNYSVKGNPGARPVGNDVHHYYYLYALERAGTLSATGKLGTHAWYPEGASYLLDKQGVDGAWRGSLTDTCFAILFLKRATRGLGEDVETPGSPVPTPSGPKETK